MNIFALDDSPILAASYHCDQHLNKMILESAQMLSTAMHIRWPGDYITSIIYAPAYKKHPCTIWAAEANSNMLWLIELAEELERLRFLRYAGSVHASIPIIQFISKFLTLKVPCARSVDHTPFVLAMPGHISVRNDLSATEKYRRYYQYKSMQWGLTQRPRMTYTRRSIPAFMEGYIQL